MAGFTSVSGVSGVAEFSWALRRVADRRYSTQAGYPKCLPRATHQSSKIAIFLTPHAACPFNPHELLRPRFSSRALRDTTTLFLSIDVVMQDLPRHSNDNAEHTSGHTLFVSPYRPYLSPSSSSTITTIIRRHHHHHQHHHHHHHRHHHHRGNHQRSHHHHRRRSFHKHHPALQPFCWVRGAMKSPDTRNPKAPEPLPSPLLSYLAHTSTRFPIPKWNPQTRNPKP